MVVLDTIYENAIHLRLIYNHLIYVLYKTQETNVINRSIAFEDKQYNVYSRTISMCADTLIEVFYLLPADKQSTILLVIHS